MPVALTRIAGPFPVFNIAYSHSSRAFTEEIAMKQSMTTICCACVLGVSALASAQTATTHKDATTNKDAMAKEMKVMGCVAQSADMSDFMLNNATMSGPMHADMKAKDDMKTMSYALKGGELKAHVGHKVEITGTMADDKTMPSASKEQMPKETTTRDTTTPKDETATGMADVHTLNVKSIKMISSTCSS
jgi:hypothetical protein